MFRQEALTDNSDALDLGLELVASAQELLGNKPVGRSWSTPEIWRSLPRRPARPPMSRRPRSGPSPISSNTSARLSTGPHRSSKSASPTPRKCPPSWSQQKVLVRTRDQGRDPAEVRRDRGAPTHGLTRRQTALAGRDRLLGTQRRRTVLRPDEAMARTRDPLRQTRAHRPRRGRPGRLHHLDAETRDMP